MMPVFMMILKERLKFDDKGSGAAPIRIAVNGAASEALLGHQQTTRCIRVDSRGGSGDFPAAVDNTARSGEFWRPTRNRKEESGMASSVAVQLKDIMQVALTVADVAQAKQFYGDVLGMKFLFEAGTMAFFRCGGVRVLIGAGETKPSGTVVYFRVPDLQGAHASLREKGVEFTEEPHMVARMPDHDLWLAFIRDPSGNLLGLMEERPALR
jgi:methylmalonyl-CoA/ethylmalonyl-CoA epimerase